jgi:hypothetical protein
MERSFADATNCHGLKRALWRQAIQDLLIATVQNLRKLLRHLSQTDPELASYLLQLFYRPAKTGSGDIGCLGLSMALARADSWTV